MCDLDRIGKDRKRIRKVYSEYVSSVVGIVPTTFTPSEDYEEIDTRLNVTLYKNLSNGHLFAQVDDDRWYHSVLGG